MQFCFLPESGTSDAVFILRRLQEDYHAKEKKLYMCFADEEKAFDRIPRSVEMGNKEERNTGSVG